MVSQVHTYLHIYHVVYINYVQLLYANYFSKVVKKKLKAEQKTFSQEVFFFVCLRYVLK